MSNPTDPEWLCHSKRSSLSKEDTPCSPLTSFLPSDPSRGHAFGDHAHTLDNAAAAAADDDDVFSIPPKHSPNPAYQRWKKTTLVLNASRRFRYTTDFKQHEKRLRTTTHAVRAAARIFQQSIINQATRVRASSLENHALDVQRFDAPETELTAVSKERIFVPSNGRVSSVDSLPDRMASLLQERNPHALEELGAVEGVAHVLEASLENGLKDDDTHYIQERRDMFGPNTYPQQPCKPFLSFVFDACKDPPLVILMVCALLSLGLGIKSHGIKEGWYDGSGIAFAVMLVVLVTSISDYRQSLQFLNLREEKRNIQVHVVRGGKKMQVSMFDLVVGDLVSLAIGDQVPADGLFVDGHSLSLDESSMTGESEPVHIDHTMPYLLSGCKVANGYGTMLVTGVGMRTEWGRFMAELGKDSGEETPLQVRLNGFVGQIGLSVAVLVLLILLIFYFTGYKAGANNTGKFRLHHASSSTVMNSIVYILAIAVSIVVLAGTLSLAYAMKKRMADKALARRLAACETMASATAICSDKTGTLTLNIMTVEKVWVADELRDAENLPHISSNLNSLLFEGIAQNTSASVFVPPEGGEPEVMGSSTEKAVLMWGLKMGMNFDLVRSLSQVETWTSIKKRAGIAVKVVNSGKVHVHWKGAAEIVLKECNSVFGADDAILSMTAAKKRELMNIIEGMASQSLQCIAFGYKEVLGEKVPSGEHVWKIPDGPLTLIAIVGIKDPCMPGVQ